MKRKENIDYVIKKRNKLIKEKAKQQSDTKLEDYGNTVAETIELPAFKNRFGDRKNDPENASKVVDSEGEPLVVYHGAVSKFESFDK